MLSEWAPTRAAATINHRLAVLGSLFASMIERDVDGGPWAGRANPVPVGDQRPTGRMSGRDKPLRQRVDLRRRVPVTIPRTIRAGDVDALISAASSLLDKAILLVLLRTGARIGGWVAVDDRHGVLGLGFDDIDALDGWVRVREGVTKRASGSVGAGRL